MVVAIAAGIGVPVCAGTTGSNSVATAADQGTYTVMHFTKDQLDEMQGQINAAPKYSAPQRYLTVKQSSGSTNLLPYLPYIPSERNQGNCGNCWVWASNGALEIEHNVNNSISDRLSIQYFNSKYEYDTGKYACSGGWLYTFTGWYNTDKSPIPLTNTNASYGDYYTNDGEPTAVPISSIATSPSYSLNSMSYSTIQTYEVGNTTAITNIESALDSNKAVWYSFFLPSAGWTDFRTFWRSGSNTSMFDPSLYNAQTQTGGHAVLIVGYDTTDPANPYWIVLNSWGTTANRTDGTYRLNMSMNYDAVYYSKEGTSYQQNTFQILNTEFTGTPAAPTVSKISPAYGPIAGGTSVTINGIGFTGATAVKFGSTPATSFTAGTADADSQIIAVAPAGTAGTVDITVTTPVGTSAISAADKFTYEGGPTVTTEIGTFRPSTGYWYLGAKSDGTVEKPVKFGKNGDIPVVGDWNNAGRSEIGVFRPSTSTWYLDYNNDGTADISVKFGKSGDIPVVGNWSSAGHTGIGVFRPSTGYWYLNYNFDGTADKTVKFGSNGDTPVVPAMGDWA